MRISEVSRRSGVAASTLRFYEDAGLLPAARLANGYRDYDEADLMRLDLIEASKELGLSLEQIGEHLAVLRTRSCTDVREHLAPLLAEQVHRLEAKRTHLEALSARLGAAQTDLAACPDSDAHCSSECVMQRQRHHP
ncbi:MerR family transcriptional regulator [uncultured Pseudokineococcus sp.]|uniref:MerR family transcriptional regulator n=1 Tax=uncultured Pseudokineococcus sp. TaxID=1642928 RepID=UPI002606D5EB|nr:MerR family transcriptional regulator [uncultured Pseudokineococcus sp.]